MTKIIDCFIFYNELELLKVRFEELYDVVDNFILVEGTLTFTGNKKKLFYMENKDMFSKYNDKVIHIICDDYPETNNPWVRERHQRNSISKGIANLKLESEDIICISDVDEIISYNIINNIKNRIIHITNFQIYSLEMTLYYYSLEWTKNKKWYHPRLLSFFKYSRSIDCETIRIGPYDSVINNAGWHISYYGDYNFIVNKLESFSEHQDNTDANKDTTFMNNCMNSGVLFFNNEKLLHVDLESNTNLPYSLIYNHVPKLAFTYWEGDELSYLHYYTIYSFCKLNPLYNVIIYICANTSNFEHPSNVNIKEEKRVFKDKLLSLKNVRFVDIDILKYLNSKINVTSPIKKADMVRIAKLYEHGGIWIDMDILFIKSIPEDIIRNTKDISYFTYSGTIATGLVISSPRNKAITYIYNKCLEILQINSDISDFQVFGPTLFRDCAFNNIELFSDCIYLDNNVVYPYKWNEPQLFFFTNNDYVKDNTICIHWYNGNEHSRRYINDFDNTQINPEKCVFEKYLYKILNE